MCAGRGEDEDVLEQGRVELCGRACVERRAGGVEEAGPVHCTHFTVLWSICHLVYATKLWQVLEPQDFDRRAQSNSCSPMSDLAVAYVFLSLLTLVIALLVAAILVTP